MKPRGLGGVLARVAVLALMLPACSGSPAVTSPADDTDTGACPEAAPLGPVSALAIGAMRPVYLKDVQAKLDALDLLVKVDIFDAGSDTPSSGLLSEYEAVLVMADLPFANSAALGDVLASYVDEGGGVVLAMFALSGVGGKAVAGRFASDDYYAISPSPRDGDRDGPHGMTPLDPGHPILGSVASFSGGSESYKPEGAAVPGTLVATWSDLPETPLVATREIDCVRRADLGFYPPTSDAGEPGFTDPATDAPRIVANALLWVGGGL